MALVASRPKPSQGASQGPSPKPSQEPPTGPDAASGGELLQPTAGRKGPRHRPARSRGAGVDRRENRVAYAMLAPAFALLAVFVTWPLVNAVFRSFYDWSFYKDSEFVGVENYRLTLTDPDFLGSVGRGLMFAFMVVPSILILAFLLASFVKSLGRRAATLLKVSIYIPTVISGVIASIIFTLIYQYMGGIANWVLSWFGIEPQAWLNDVKLALGSIAVPAIWLGLGIPTLIMLAGLLDIPQMYYEAASLEGASAWQRTRYITLPLMKNIFLYLMVTGFVGAVQQLDLPLVMTGGGPLDSTLLPNLYIFNHFRSDISVGPSIAAALLLFVVLGSISAVIFRILNSEKAVDS